MRFLLLWALAIGFLGISFAEEAKTPRREILVSEPLWIHRGYRLRLPIPPGWRIKAQEPKENWKYSSYDFDLEQVSGKERLVILGEVLQHTLPRARRHGDLDGYSYTTRQGWKGIRTASWGEMYADGENRQKIIGEHDRKLAIPLPQSDYCAIVRFITHYPDPKKEPRETMKAVEYMYQQIRLEPVLTGNAGAK